MDTVLSYWDEINPLNQGVIKTFIDSHLGGFLLILALVLLLLRWITIRYKEKSHGKMLFLVFMLFLVLSAPLEMVAHTGNFLLIFDLPITYSIILASVLHWLFWNKWRWYRGKN